MKEDKVIYVLKLNADDGHPRDFRQYGNSETVNRSYYNRFEYGTREVGCQYEIRNNIMGTCRNEPILRPPQFGYFGFPKLIYAYHGTRSVTDIGVGSVKALIRKRVKKIYLPETDDRGVGSSDLSSLIMRKTRQPKYSFYDHKKTSSKCVGGIVEYNVGCVLSQKLSPIIHTKSGTTSPIVQNNNNPHNESKRVISNATATSIQNNIDVTKKGPSQVMQLNVKDKKVKAKPDEPKDRPMTVTKSVDTGNKEQSKDYSSDSLVQHVHNLENFSEEKACALSIDLIENKLEKEYRSIFSKKSKEEKSKPNKTNSEIKSTSFLKRRFEALRRGLSKKEDTRKSSAMPPKESSHTSRPSHKDVSIVSDPPSLEARSFSNTKMYSSNTKIYDPVPSIITHERMGYKRREMYKTRTIERQNRDWEEMEGEDSDTQGVKGMLKLWGQQFNLEEESKNERTPTPSIRISKRSVKETEQYKQSKTDSEGKKERKFFFFKKKGRKDKNKPYKNKNAVTTGRCEVRDGLMIKIGASDTHEVVKNPEPVVMPENYNDILRKAWFRKYLSETVESKKSVNVRWNNNTYVASSSTVFELMDNVYKEAGVIIKSSSEISVTESAYYRTNNKKYHVNFANQNFEAWMIPKTLPDAPKELPLKVRLKSMEAENKNTKTGISDQTWFKTSKEFARQIEIVLHTQNIANLDKNKSSEYLTIDIPKGFFIESNSENYKQNQSSEETVYNIIEYETGSEQKKMKGIGNSQTTDRGIKNIELPCKTNEKIDLQVPKTVLKPPPMRTDAIIQNSHDLAQKRCDIVSVGIITHTQRELKENKKPIISVLRINDDKECSDNIIRYNKNKREFAQSYLQEYYEHWHPLGIDFFSWCVSDSHLNCCLETPKTSFNIQDVTKSCPNISDDFQRTTGISSCDTSSCSHFVAYVDDDKAIEKGFNNKRNKVEGTRAIPKDSIQVYKRRMFYAMSNKSKWNDDDDDEENGDTCNEGTNQEFDATKNQCPLRGNKPCWKNVERAKQNTKHVSMSNCGAHDKMDELPGILAFKGLRGCDTCKKSSSGHRTVKVESNIPSEIPSHPCERECKAKKHPPCAAHSHSSDKLQCSTPKRSNESGIKLTCGNKQSNKARPPCSPPKNSNDSVEKKCCGNKPATKATQPPKTQCSPLKSSDESVAKNCCGNKPATQPPNTSCSPPKSSNESVEKKCCGNKPAAIPPCSPLKNSNDSMKKGGVKLTNAPRNAKMPTCPPKNSNDSSGKNCGGNKPPTSPKMQCSPSGKSIAPDPKQKQKPLCQQVEAVACSPHNIGRPQASKKGFKDFFSGGLPQIPKKGLKNFLSCVLFRGKKDLSSSSLPKTWEQDFPAKRSKSEPKSSCVQCEDDMLTFPWPTKNQVSNQSFFKDPETNLHGEKDCVVSPHGSNCSVHLIKLVNNNDCCDNEQASPNCPGRTSYSPRIPPMTCKSPPQTKEANTCKPLISGIHLKVKPSKMQSNCKDDEKTHNESCCIRLSSKEQITIRMKAQTASTEEIREGLNIKVQDDDGQTLYERRDYNNQNTCHRTSVLGEIYNSNINIHRVQRVPTQMVGDAMTSNKCCDNEMNEEKSETSVANLIEIQFQMRVTQGDKTTEINIANDGDKDNKTEKKEKFNNSPEEVYVVKNEPGLCTENKDTKNDINIRILIKNFKSKEKRENMADDFSRKISEKFHTVSTGYSNNLCNQVDDKVFSVHRTTVDLTNSNEISMIPKKPDFIDSESISVIKSFCHTNNVSITEVVEEQYTTCKRQHVSDKEMLIKTFSRKLMLSPEMTSKNNSNFQDPYQLKKQNSNVKEETTTKNFTIEKGYLSDKDDITEKTDISEHTDKDDFALRDDLTERDGIITEKEDYTEKDDITTEKEDNTEREDLTDNYFTEDSDTKHLKENDVHRDWTMKDLEKVYRDVRQKKSFDQNYNAIVTSDTDQELVLEVNTSNEQDVAPSMEMIIKPRTKDEKKEMLKNVFEKANEIKAKDKTKMRQLREMLKTILTSDSSGHAELKVKSNELAKDLTYASLKPNYFRDSDSMSNYYNLEGDSRSGERSKIRPMYPTENCSRCSKASAGVSSDNEVTHGECMCNTLATRLNLSKVAGCGGCCCSRGPRTTNQEVECSIKSDDYLNVSSQIEPAFVDVETQHSKLKAHTSTDYSVQSYSKTDIVTTSNVLQVEEITANLVETEVERAKRSRHSKHVKDYPMKKLNKATRLKISNEPDTVGGTSNVDDTISEVQETRSSDILQSYATKKAVLEIYAQKTISKDGERLVAKLPRFVYDRENEIEMNFEAMATNTYKTVCKRNILMMSIKR